MADTDIWMPFYFGDYIADTMHLTTQQHGCYLLLMAHYWRKGPPPDDDTHLAAVVKLPLKIWRKTRKKMENFFQIREGKWHHKRIDREKEQALQNARFYRRRAMAGVKARKENAVARELEVDLKLDLKGTPAPAPAPAPVLHNKAKLTDEQFIEALKANVAYKGVNIEKEIGKMKAWLLTPKGRGRKLTRRFMVNWLNNADAEMETPPAPGKGGRGYKL